MAANTVHYRIRIYIQDPERARIQLLIKAKNPTLIRADIRYARKCIRLKLDRWESTLENSFGGRYGSSNGSRYGQNMEPNPDSNTDIYILVCWKSFGYKVFLMKCHLDIKSLNVLKSATFKDR